VDQEGERVSGTQQVQESEVSQGEGPNSPVLEAEGLVKLFGRVVGLRGVNIRLFPGEVLAVIGDNGAGKSTLIKCLSGAMLPDQGTIKVDGQRVTFRSTQDARAAGIETVYQTLAVAPALDIASNLFLAREIRREGVAGKVFRMLDKKSMRQQAKSHLDDLGITTLQNIDQAVETLSGGQRQVVAVARSRPARQGPRGDPDQPQHAERLRDRGPDPHPAPRRQRGSDQSEDAQHAGRGGDHDRRQDGRGRRAVPALNRRTP
jgi:ABC-type branched-subunit amino acid transport system ATPase component